MKWNNSVNIVQYLFFFWAPKHALYYGKSSAKISDSGNGQFNIEVEEKDEDGLIFAK